MSILARTTCFTLIGLVSSFIGAADASAASGEMGTGYPLVFGTYGPNIPGSANTTVVWTLQNASIGFPPGCPNIRLSQVTLGADGYNRALATLLTARVSGRAVRFFAHAERDGGCGIDYIQMND